MRKEGKIKDSIFLFKRGMQVGMKGNRKKEKHEIERGKEKKGERGRKYGS